MSDTPPPTRFLVKPSILCSIRYYWLRTPSSPLPLDLSSSLWICAPNKKFLLVLHQNTPFSLPCTSPARNKLSKSLMLRLSVRAAIRSLSISFFPSYLVENVPPPLLRGSLPTTRSRLFFFFFFPRFFVSLLAKWKSFPSPLVFRFTPLLFFQDRRSYNPLKSPAFLESFLAGVNSTFVVRAFPPPLT